MDYKLYLFDLDGTLADMKSDQLYPEAEAWFKENKYREWAICTNQGGIGLRYWMEEEGFGNPKEYPTLESFWKRIETLFPKNDVAVYMCIRYQSKKTGQWSPMPFEISNSHDLKIWDQSWRKPAPGMLLQAMQARNIQPHETLMVGDRDEDQQAAEAAGCGFMWANEFFKKERE